MTRPDDRPKDRRRPRFFGDWSVAIATAGTRTGRRLGNALDRRPVGLPLAALVAGVGLIVAASVLSPGTGNPPGGGPASSLDLLVGVSMLFAAGGVLVVAGLAGLASAAVVHIVRRSGR